MARYTIDEMVGRNINMLMPSPYAEQHDTYLSNYRNTAVKRIIGRTRMVEARHKNGATFRTLLSVNEVATDSGYVHFFFFFFSFDKMLCLFCHQTSLFFIFFYSSSI